MSGAALDRGLVPEFVFVAVFEFVVVSVPVFVIGRLWVDLLEFHLDQRRRSDRSECWHRSWA